MEISSENNADNNKVIIEERNEPNTSVDLKEFETNVPVDVPAPELFVSLINDDKEEGTKLTLAYERLYEIPRAIVENYADTIKYLDISYNKITNLDALVYFKNLTSLIADHNPITENCEIPPLPKLQLLWLNHCKIGSLYPWLERLRESCSELKYLCVMGNPAAPSYLNGGTFYEYLQYRLFVISQFPSLNHLDDRTITEDERTEAQRLYKRPFFQRLIKPGTSGLSGLVHKSVSWNTISTFGGLLRGKHHDNEIDRVRSERNLIV